MRVADLFCGMGGLALGFSRLGCQVTGYDASPACVATFRHNGLGTAVVMDLLRGRPEGRFDIVVGGPPCQPWSPLNMLRRKANHPLYPAIFRMIEFIDELSPRAFVIENLPLILHDVEVMRKLDGLEKYRIAKRVIRYSDYGAATSRRRAFILGVLRSEGVDPGEVFDEIPRGRPATVRDAIWDLRGRGRDPAIHHVWPRIGAAAVGRYRSRYQSGRFAYYVLRWDRPAPSFGNVMKTYILHPDSLDGGETRPISVREAMRLMGFPDGFRFPPGVGMRDMYQMVADSVSPVFSEKLAKTLLAHL
ncbi:MAG: DNA cytosine methyltransferase [Nitrososphaerota archaeon]